MIIQCIKKRTADHRADNLLATDTDGKILVSIHNWAKEDGLLDYSDLKESMRFLDKYAFSKSNLIEALKKQYEGDLIS